MQTEKLPKIIHIDMDAFYAAVEIRDNPALFGKPLIIGALPTERGVVATCSYEARVFGVRSAMNIKEAYRRCPHGIYMRPSGGKYSKASKQIRKIWRDYTDICEYISLDEGFLDVTGSEHLFGGARAIGYEVKRRVKEEAGLTCSVGVGYSMMSAKLASEEDKPDGYFEILSPSELRNLIIDRSVRVIYGVGAKTAEQLAQAKITTVRDILNNPQTVITLLGNYGRQVIELANGVDCRKVTADADAKSIGTEQTFQQDITDFDYLKDVLLLTAEKLSFDIKQRGLYSRTITLKVTYKDMKSITRSKSGEATDKTADIYKAAAFLFDKIEKRPIRLIGITLNNLTDTPELQISLFDMGKDVDKLDNAMMNLQLKYGQGIVKTAGVLRAEKNVNDDY